MRGHEAEERFAHAVAEKHVAQVGRVFGFQARTETVLADFLERAGKPAGIARELHGRGIGEKFALAADGGLDQAAKENADGAEQHQSQADERQRIVVAAAAAARAQQNAADGGDAQQAENDADEPEVQPHVAVQECG